MCYVKKLSVFGRPFVKRVALCYRSVVCLSCLSVTFVHCGQTVGRIKTKLGKQVGRGPGHIVLDRDPAPPPTKGHSPHFRSISVAAKWLHITWYGARPRPRRLCVKWGPRSPSQKGGRSPPISAHVYCDQTAGWMKVVLGMEVGLSPGDFVLDGDSLPFPKRGQSPLPNFRPISTVAKRLDASKCKLVWMLASAQGTLC